MDKALSSSYSDLTLLIIREYRLRRALVDKSPPGGRPKLLGGHILPCDLAPHFTLFSHSTAGCLSVTSRLSPWSLPCLGIRLFTSSARANVRDHSFECICDPMFRLSVHAHAKYPLHTSRRFLYYLQRVPNMCSARFRIPITRRCSTEPVDEGRRGQHYAF